MSAKEKDLTAKEIRDILDYNPQTGEFSWKTDKPNGYKTGMSAGSTTARQYRSIHINYHPFYAHRLAWLIMTGEWPKNHIDHINHITYDNRWENLREATQAQSQHNRRSLKPTVKYKGVAPTPSGKWQSRIMANGQKTYLGLFNTAEEAAQAYNDAAHRAFGEFAHLNEISE